MPSLFVAGFHIKSTRRHTISRPDNTSITQFFWRGHVEITDFHLTNKHIVVFYNKYNRLGES